MIDRAKTHLNAAWREAVAAGRWPEADLIAVAYKRLCSDPYPDKPVPPPIQEPIRPIEN